MAPRNYGSVTDVPSDDTTLELSSSNESEPLIDDRNSGKATGFSNPRTNKRITYAMVAAAVLALGVAFLGKEKKVFGAWSSSKRNRSSTSGVLSSESLVNPEDLKFISAERLKEQSPGPAWGEKLLESGKPLPTNSWYLNMLSRDAGTDHPSEANRVYTVPYIIDTAGSIPGIRIHWPTVKVNDRNMQMVVNAANGLTVGAASPPGGKTTTIGRQYTLADLDEDEELSMLGVSLQWKGQVSSGGDATANGEDANTTVSDPLLSTDGTLRRRSLVGTAAVETESVDSMTTHLVRGMPYATMEYSGENTFPSITSGGRLASPPLIDGDNELKCGELTIDDITKQPSGFSTDAPSMTAEREVLLHFESSDFTWIIFFSQPVEITCFELPESNGMVGLLPDTMFQMFATPIDPTSDDEPLVTRVALANECTTGKSNVAEHCRETRKMKGEDNYLDLLRENAGMYPKSPVLGIDMSLEDNTQEARYTFDWDVQSFSVEADEEETDDDSGGDGDIDKKATKEIIMFALPHHQEMIESIDGVSTNKVLTDYCKPTFHGSTCLVRGNKWSLVEKLGERQSFIADRPPRAFAIPDLAEALAYDIKYELSDNLKRAAADTYFSGKILARMGRVLLIAKELQNLADGVAPEIGSYSDDLDKEWYSSAVAAAKEASLPSEKEFERALEELKKGIEVWIDGSGEAQYLYDDTWGGLVNCGCRYTASDASGFCNNTFPDCPALIDVNEDFGNGFYNDHHFHYGYNIYAAAVAAKFDPAWGRNMFDRIMLYVRDIANPTPDDPFFPRFRQKDWFLGSSWASGIISMNTPHGRNQESSSEAIAAYEGVTLFGAAMAEAFKQTSEHTRVRDAEKIREAGRLLTAMEVSATQRYWHVWNSSTHNNTYPVEYKLPVVGMLYETMASFQTWFEGGDMASIGIQLLPFTPVSERRDNPEWAALVYPPYEESCDANYDFCVKNGWSVMLCGLRATIGDREGALKDALDIPVKVFQSEGGNGHTRSNLIWYVSTRPDVELKTEKIETIAEKNSTLVNPDRVTAP